MTVTVKRAIRSDVGWATMTAEEQAVYDDIHYTLLSTWESTIPPDLVAVDEQWVAECYNDWVGGLVDHLRIYTTITSATNSIIVKPADGNRHTGTFDSGFGITYGVPNGELLEIEANYCTIDGIDFHSNEVGGTTIMVKGYVNDPIGTTIENCIFRSDDPRTGLWAVHDSTIRNCLFHNLTRAQEWVWGGHTMDISNCTAIDCTEAGFRSAGTGTIFISKNNAAFNCAIAFDEGTVGTMTGSNNADDDGSALALGIGTIDDVSASDFTNYVGEDYSIPAGSKLIDEGTDLSTEFTTDIVGTIRG